MAILVTEAIVLHAFDYLESSRIFRLATLDAGVQSVLARGARRSRNRFGSAMGLFSKGVAHVAMRDSSDLHNISSFEVHETREALALDYSRFVGASMLAELVLRFSGSEPNPHLFVALDVAMQELARAPGERAHETALAGAWSLVSALGFAPSLESCASCHSIITPGVDVAFSHRAGGVLCERCARVEAVRRRIPTAARDAIIAWTEGGEAPVHELPAEEVRAHMRLLREFLTQHFGEEKGLRAFGMWAGSVSRAS